MSDMEMFCDMLNRAGVRYEKRHAGNFYADEEGTVTAVELTAQRGAVNGYNGFTAFITLRLFSMSLNCCCV